MKTDETTPGMAEPDAAVKAFKAYAAELEPIDGERDVIATITTSDVDRDHEVVEPKGIGLANFAKNPVVLWAHDYAALPVAKALWIKPSASGKGLVARLRFARHAVAEDVYQLYKGGFMTSFSIGFLSLEGGKPTAAEVKARAELKDVNYVHRRSELLEFSCVPIPANPQAVTIAKGMSPEVRDAVEAAGKTSGIPDVSADAPETKDLMADAASRDAAEDRRAADPGVMIGLWPPMELAEKLALPGGESADELHLTLCYLGRLSEVGTAGVEKAARICADAARWTGTIAGMLNGLGRFSATDSSDGLDVIYASPDLPGLSEFRYQLAASLDCCGIPPKKNHGYTQHITLAYVPTDADTPMKRLEPVPVAFDELYLCVGEDRRKFPFLLPDTYGYPIGFRVADDGSIVAKALSEGSGSEGGDTVPGEDETEEKAGGASLNQAGVSHARSLISAGKVSDGAWSFSGADGDALLGDDDWDAYGKWFLGVDAAEPKDTKAHYKYPFGKGGEVYLGALRAIRSRAAQQGASGIEAAAGTLLDAAEPDRDKKAAKPHAEPDSDDMGGKPDADADDKPGSGIRAGDYVECGFGRMAYCGRVKSIHRNGKVPGVENDVEGSEDEPAARVHLYHKASPTDRHRPTEPAIHKGAMCRDLTKIPHEMDGDDSDMDDAPAEKPSAKSSGIPDGPPARAPKAEPTREDLIAGYAKQLGKVRTAEQVEADLLARVVRGIDADAIAGRIQDRRDGVI